MLAIQLPKISKRSLIGVLNWECLFLICTNCDSTLSFYHSCLTGSVAVYSACDKQAKPLYCSTAKTGKHTDPVWEVRWCKCNSNTNELQLPPDLLLDSTRLSGFLQISLNLIDTVF